MEKQSREGREGSFRVLLLHSCPQDSSCTVENIPGGLRPAFTWNCMEFWNFSDAEPGTSGGTRGPTNASDIVLITFPKLPQKGPGRTYHLKEGQSAGLHILGGPASLPFSLTWSSPSVPGITFSTISLHVSLCSGSASGDLRPGWRMQRLGWCCKYTWGFQRRCHGEGVFEQRPEERQ